MLVTVAAAKNWLDGVTEDIPAMKTQRLRILVDPRQARLLLDSYVSSAANLPPTARKQDDLARLPLAFHERVERAESDGLVWSAWIHGPDAWLFTGQLNLNRARERGHPVLELEVYDYERRTKNRIVAMRGSDGSWHLLKD
jgi:hypothetical protein